ncbi:metallophosphoesterase [Cellulosimicrobium composti]|uniref:Metallophosphoesterase n=1 Tax=Cellulosimicrobium composti TaxID=2672572 RepID=A0ABX0BCX2_9MICO|nr:metallophosphoesterase [Cellulosimicrobium composti]NDO89396.1 metallophosphoesterase [Cellulosimicrobium composti]
MSRPHRTPPRWVRWTLAVLLALVPCVVWGVTTATAERSLGPHEARYEVTTNDLVTVDLGPLGTIQIRSPLPLGLGVDVTVEEIPADLTAVGQADTLEGLTQDLEDYLRFFGGPQETISSVTRALVADALRRTGFAIVVVGLAGGGLYLLLGASRRRELSERVAPRTYEITASVVLVSLVAASLAASDPGTTRGPSQRASVVFDGTPLEGARITGRLAGVVDTYGAMLIDLYRENEDFYARANANLEAAWERREHIQRLTRPRLDAVPASDDDPTDAPTGDGTATGADEAPPAGADDTGTTGGEGATGDETTDEGAPGADATGDATDDAATGEEDAGDRDGGASGDTSGDDEEPTPEPAAEEDLVTLLVVSDLHCNTGMAPLIRTAVERSGANVVLNAGDTTMNGTAVESFCVDSFASAVPQGVTMVVADGNHDSVETSAQERANGQTVLDGKIVEVEGIRILGDRDPLETRLGLGSQPPREETPEEYAARLTEVACAAQEDGDGVDLLLIHTPRMGNEALDSACVPNQVSGHMHTRSGPVRFGGGVRYVSGSTAGAVKDQLRIGPLKGTAEMTVLRFDPQQRRIVDWQLVQVGTDESAKVWPRIAWPTPSGVPVPDEPLEGESGEVGTDDGDPAGTPGDAPSGGAPQG